MDRHNAPAVLSFSKGGTTFFHQNVFNKADESLAAPRINMLKDACLWGKKCYTFGEELNIFTTTCLLLCRRCSSSKKQQFDLNLS